MSLAQSKVLPFLELLWCVETRTLQRMEHLVLSLLVSELRR